MAYASAFQGAIRSALAPLPTAAQPGSAVFSAACFHHCVTQEPSFWAIKVYNVSFRQLSAAWFYNDEAPLRYVENCTGFKCGSCRSHRMHPGAPPDPRAKPPRAPAPPDPFAVWSPPPTPSAAAPRGAAASALSAALFMRGWKAALLSVALATALLCAAWTALARRGRRLRIASGEMELEQSAALLADGAGRQPYGAAGGKPVRMGAGGVSRAGDAGGRVAEPPPAVSPAAGAPRGPRGMAGPRPPPPPRP